MLKSADRGIRSGWFALGAIVILLGIAAGAGIALWQRGANEDASKKTIAQGDRSPLAQFAHRDEPFPVTFSYPFDAALMTGTAATKRQPDTQLQAREALNALFADQRASQAAVLREVKVRTIYIDAAGNAYIDLALLQQKELRASAWEELLAIYAMVNTVMQNFEEIKQVRFLMDGKEAQTLAGHIDLSRRFFKRMDLVRQ